jgi:hypothetical protein
MQSQLPASNISLHQPTQIQPAVKDFGTWCWHSISLLTDQVQKEVKAFGARLVEKTAAKSLTDEIMMAAAIFGLESSILEIEGVATSTSQEKNLLLKKTIEQLGNYEQCSPKYKEYLAKLSKSLASIEMGQSSGLKNSEKAALDLYEQGQPSQAQEVRKYLSELSGKAKEEAQKFTLEMRGYVYAKENIELSSLLMGLSQAIYEIAKSKWEKGSLSDVQSNSLDRLILEVHYLKEQGYKYFATILDDMDAMAHAAFLKDLAPDALQKKFELSLKSDVMKEKLIGALEFALKDIDVEQAFHEMDTDEALKFSVFSLVVQGHTTKCHPNFSQKAFLELFNMLYLEFNRRKAQYNKMQAYFGQWPDNVWTALDQKGFFDALPYSLLSEKSVERLGDGRNIFKTFREFELSDSAWYLDFDEKNSSFVKVTQGGKFVINDYDEIRKLIQNSKDNCITCKHFIAANWLYKKKKELENTTFANFDARLDYWSSHAQEFLLKFYTVLHPISGPLRAQGNGPLVNEIKSSINRMQQALQQRLNIYKASKKQKPAATSSVQTTVAFKQ